LKDSEKKKTGTSLRKKIIWIVLLAGSLPILVFLIINNLLIYSSYKNILYNEQKEKVELGAERIAVFITDIQNILKSKSETVAFQEKKIDETEYSLKKATARFDYFLKTALYDEDGNLLFFVTKQKDEEKTDTEKEAPPEALSHEILKSINEKGRYFSEIYYDQKKLPRIDIFVPVRDDNGKIIGIIYSAVDLRHIRKIVGSLSTRKYSFAYLIDSEGNILIHPGKAKLRKDFNWKSIPPVKLFMDHKENAANVRLDIYPNVDGLRVVGTVANVPGTDWGLILERKERDVYGRIYSFFWISFAVSLVILLIGLLVAYRFINTTLSPFDKLYVGAEAISAGDLRHRIQINTGDELQELSESFNKMAVSLEKQKQKNLESLEQLKEKKKELEISNLHLKEASQLKSEFLANMSHELRTPMNTIIGYTSIILDGIYGELSDKQESSLKKIYQNARNLSHLIDDILNLSKIDAGKMPIFTERFFVSEVVKESLVPHKSRINEKGLTLNLNIKDDIEIETDRSKIKQVLTHLINNAIKFTSEGSITVACEKSKTDDYVKITVADTGIGIEKESLGKIFEEFRQLDGSYTREYGGTGLGLSIVKKILDMLEAKITVKSKVNEGSTFNVFLPIRLEKQVSTSRPAKIEAKSERKAVQDDAEDTTEIEDVTKKVILSIDDEPDVIEMMKDAVGRTGYRVVGANDGEEGIKLARKIRPYLITIDINIPGKNGWEVIRELKRNPITLDIPIFIISIADEKAKGFSMGVTEYFVKPIDRNLLLRRLAVLSRLRGKRILVIDDDHYFLENFFYILREHGFILTSCDSGIEGLEKLKTEKPDLLILDIMMPKFSGYDVLDAMEKENLSKDVPVIVLTAKELTRYEHDELSKRVVTVIKKTGISREELLPRLRSIFERIWCQDVTNPIIDIENTKRRETDN